MQKKKEKNIIKQKWIRMIFTEKIRDYITGVRSLLTVKSTSVTPKWGDPNMKILIIQPILTPKVSKTEAWPLASLTSLLRH